MKKEVLAAATHQRLKYYFNPAFDKIPQEVKKEILESVIYMTEQLKCGFSIGFYENGDVYLETIVEDDMMFDAINETELIEKFRKEKYEMIKSLTLYYKLFIKGGYV